MTRTSKNGVVDNITANNTKRVFFGWCISDEADEDAYIALMSQIHPPKVVLKPSRKSMTIAENELRAGLVAEFADEEGYSISTTGPIRIVKDTTPTPKKAGGAKELLDNDA